MRLSCPPADSIVSGEATPSTCHRVCRALPAVGLIPLDPGQVSHRGLPPASQLCLAASSDMQDPTLPLAPRRFYENAVRAGPPKLNIPNIRGRFTLTIMRLLCPTVCLHMRIAAHARVVPILDAMYLHVVVLHIRVHVQCREFQEMGREECKSLNIKTLAVSWHRMTPIAVPGACVPDSSTVQSYQCLIL